MTHQPGPALSHNIAIGDKLYFSTDKRPYAVKAADDRYVIATKPFNARKTVLYTILDFEGQWRGPNDWVFNPYDYSVQSDIDQCLADLQKDEAHLSRRHGLRLVIERIVKGKK